ncbi:MAG TPA: magnesium transporter CorA family protein [Candidatus Acidoferrum sp.]|nr:magnesium transporter CorA family protein [Candidatus Acidoferrum sp.]
MRRDYQLTNGKPVEIESGSGQISVFINPDDTEKKYLVDELKLDEHTLASALDPDELSRLEFEPEHVAVIFKRPLNYVSGDQFLFKVGSTGAYLFRDRMVIVVSDDVALFDGLQNRGSFSPAGLILKLIFRTIIHFRGHLKVISKISDDLQDKINKSLENRNLIDMFTLQKSLVYYVNSLNSNGVLIEKLRNHAARIGFTPEELESLDDTLIENNQCLKQADISSSILAGLMDARVSIVSNNLNMLMKTLNIITIAIMVPTLVVSIFSMNVTIPLQERGEAFWIIMGFAVLSMAGVMALWRLKKW